MLLRCLVVVCAAIVPAWMAMAAAQRDDPSGDAGHRLLVVNKLGDTLSIIDPATGEEEARVELGTGPHEVAASPDGLTAVVGNYGRRQPGRSLTVVDVVEGRVIRTIDLEQYHRPHGVVYLEDGRRVLVTAEQERRLLIVDVEAGEVTAAIDTGQAVSHMVALTPDGRHAYVPNIRPGTVSIIDMEKQELAKVVETGAGAEGVAAHPTRPEVWISNRAADTVSIIDTETMEVVETLDSPGFPIRVVISPDGRHALVVNARGDEVAVFDVQERSLVKSIPMEAEPKEDEGRMFPADFGQAVPIGVVFAPDGSRAYVALTRADVVAVIDTGNWEVIDHFDTDREPDGLAWAQVGQE